MDHSHRRALVDSFFRKKDEELLANLREQVRHDNALSNLSKTSGITDIDVLEHLLSIGVCGESVTALSLVPLIQVAWADGFADAKERTVVMQAVHDAGVEEGTAGHQLVEHWLTEKPDPGLWNDWTVYAKTLSDQLPPTAKRMIKDGLMTRSRKVAEASCGLMQLKLRISAAEQAVLDGINEVFDT